MVQNSFVFYDSFRDAVEDMDDKDRLAFYEAIINYSLDGKPPDELSKELVRMFKLVKPQLDANTKRKKDGKKGGRPSKKDNENVSNNYEETIVSEEENYKKTSGFENKNHRLKNKKPNVNVNDNVNVNENDNNNNNANDSCVDGLQDVINFYNDNVGQLTPFGLTLITDYVQEMGKDIVIYAMQIAVEANKRTIQYIKAILNNWQKAGIKTLAEAKNESKQKNKKTALEEFLNG